MSRLRAALRDGGRDEAAQVMLRLLYPPPLTVTTSSGDDREARASYLLLPSRTRPRIVVPARQPRTSTQALRRQMTGQRPRTRAARALLSLGLRTGAMDRLHRHGVVVRGPSDAEAIDSVLQRILDVPTVRLTMPIGPARANRKPVLQVTDETGHVLAFVKVGHDQLTRSLVRREGSALKRLSEVSWRIVRPPQARAVLDWGDLAVLVLEPLPIPHRRIAAQDERQRLVEAVREIAQSFGTSTCGWDSNPFLARLRHDLAACGDRGDAFTPSLTAMDIKAPVLELGAWHGDLNPGNVAMDEHECWVWDWERFEEDVPVGFDLLHHDLQRAITVEGQSPSLAARALVANAADVLSPLGVPAKAAVEVVQLYLLTIAARYLADDQEAAGAALGRVEDWVAPALRPAGVSG